ncbi:MAG: tRNA (adenosine(37)-N6)-dimethylallyltransferase MiaA, partial [Cyanobacteria bacterium P01_F01_bin.153]
MKRGLIVICGPTAAGKTALSIALAKKLASPILGADSRQIYRELDIGTAKPTPEERAQAPHHLVDCWDPRENLTLAVYQSQAQELIENFHSQAGNSTAVPLVVGGTGLYIKSIVRGMKIPQVPPQHELRSQLKTIDQHERYQWLRQVDLPASEKIHPNDSTRTLRALEVFYATGSPLSSLQGEEPPTYPILTIGVDCLNDPVGKKGADHPGDRLTGRIRKRTAAMLDQGLVDEVRGLRDRYGADLPLLKTLGYEEIGQYLDGDLTLEQAEMQIVRHTRQFAKRQRTWFRSDASIKWIDSDNPQQWNTVWGWVDDFLQA